MNTLAADGFNARLKLANLVTKADFDNTLSCLNNKITANKTKNDLKKLKSLDLSYFIGKRHFEEDGKQNYLGFQPLNKYFKIIANADYVSSWKSKELSDQTIKPPSTADNSLTALVSHYGTKMKVQFSGSCLKQPKTSYTHETIVNIYNIYELGASGSNDNGLTLKNGLFGAATLTKNTAINKYGYSGYGIGFDSISIFSFPGGGFG